MHLHLPILPSPFVDVTKPHLVHGADISGSEAVVSVEQVCQLIYCP